MTMRMGIDETAKYVEPAYQLERQCMSTWSGEPEYRMDKLYTVGRLDKKTTRCCRAFVKKERGRK